MKHFKIIILTIGLISAGSANAWLYKCIHMVLDDGHIVDFEIYSYTNSTCPAPPGHDNQVWNNSQQSNLNFAEDMKLDKKGKGASTKQIIVEPECIISRVLL